MSSVRFYRREVCGGRFKSFTVKVRETDLWIAVSAEAFSSSLPALTEGELFRIRRPLEQYLEQHSYLQSALQPCLVDPDAPPLVVEMIRAGNLAGVGPMAAVAGALAEATGKFLMNHAPEVIVENGGDLFIKVTDPLSVGLYAGQSAVSGKLALLVDPHKTPLGICTSSGTVGPSVSFGCTDAAVAVAPSTALADAAATALGNLVQSAADLETAIASAQEIRGLSGALLVIGDHMAAWGEIRLQRL